MGHGLNQPDDWNCWTRRCPDCGATHHASGGCDCRERRAEEDERLEETLSRLPEKVRASVRRMIEEIGEEP